MSEPKAKAQKIEELTPGVRHWTVHDDRIDNRGDAYALATPDGWILIDPLPLEPKLLQEFDRVAAICLTIQSHQRSAWRYQKHFGAKVYAPPGSQGLEGTPDFNYGDRQTKLPDSLRAIHSPGPTQASYSLVWDKTPQERWIFCGDVIVGGEEGEPSFVPDQYQDEPRVTRTIAHPILEEKPQVLCSGHAAPWKKDVKAWLEKLLERSP